MEVEGGGQEALERRGCQTDLEAPEAVHLAILVSSLILDRALMNYASKAALLTRGHPARVDGAPQVPQSALSVHHPWEEGMIGVSDEIACIVIVHQALFSPCIEDLLGTVLSRTPQEREARQWKERRHGDKQLSAHRRCRSTKAPPMLRRRNRRACIRPPWKEGGGT